MKNMYVQPLAIAISAIVPVSATPLIEPNLSEFSFVAGGYTFDGAGASGTSAGDQNNMTGFNGALAELSAAKNSLNLMQTTSILSPTVSGIIDLAPGVYSAIALKKGRAPRCTSTEAVWTILCGPLIFQPLLSL